MNAGRGAEGGYPEVMPMVFELDDQGPEYGRFLMVPMGASGADVLATLDTYLSPNDSFIKMAVMLEYIRKSHGKDGGRTWEVSDQDPTFAAQFARNIGGYASAKDLSNDLFMRCGGVEDLWHGMLTGVFAVCVDAGALACQGFRIADSAYDNSDANT